MRKTKIHLKHKCQQKRKPEQVNSNIIHGVSWLSYIYTTKYLDSHLIDKIIDPAKDQKVCIISERLIKNWVSQTLS